VLGRNLLRVLRLGLGTGDPQKFPGVEEAPIFDGDAKPTACGYLDCYECGKPRLVYFHSPRGLTKPDVAALITLAREGGNYMCGQPFPAVYEDTNGYNTFVPPSYAAEGGGVPLLDYKKVVGVVHGINCNSPIQPDFYRKVAPPGCYEKCFYCGERCNEGGTPPEVDGWAWALPFCDTCKEGDPAKGVKGLLQPVGRQRSKSVAGRAAGKADKAAKKARIRKEQAGVGEEEEDKEEDSEMSESDEEGSN
jgi:hypothetical protein